MASNPARSSEARIKHAISSWHPSSRTAKFWQSFGEILNNNDYIWSPKKQLDTHWFQSPPRVICPNSLWLNLPSSICFDSSWGHRGYLCCTRKISEKGHILNGESTLRTTLWQKGQLAQDTEPWHFIAFCRRQTTRYTPTRTLCSIYITHKTQSPPNTQFEHRTLLFIKQLNETERKFSR